MISDNKMEDYARDCVRLAHVVNDPVIRERILQMAREWMAAVMHEEKTPEPATNLTAATASQRVLQQQQTEPKKDGDPE